MDRFSTEDMRRFRAKVCDLRAWGVIGILAGLVSLVVLGIRLKEGDADWLGYLALAFYSFAAGGRQLGTANRMERFPDEAQVIMVSGWLGHG